MEVTKSSKSKYLILIEVIPFIVLMQGNFDGLTLFGAVFYVILIIRNLFWLPFLHTVNIGRAEVINAFSIIIAVSFAVTFRNQLNTSKVQGDQIYLYGAFVLYIVSFFRVNRKKQTAS